MLDSLFNDMADMAVTQESMTMSKKEDQKNFRHSYSEYETQAEAEMFAKRETARNMQPSSVWQRISETVVPEIDIVINPVSVTVTPVA
jgi:hypothetical protein